MAWRMRRPTVAILIAAGAVVTIFGALALRKLVRIQTVTELTGAIIAQSKDRHQRRPIGNAIVSAGSGTASGKAVSANSGLFRLRLDHPIGAGEMVELKVEHPDYRNFTMTAPAGDQLHVIRLAPAEGTTAAAPAGPGTKISNLRVRYATRGTTTTTIGTTVRMLDVDNTGNVPCAGRQPCSPDGKWKATVRSLSLDTGEADKQFRNVRVSCIAGPCPFTTIDVDQFSRGGRAITLAVRNWSDPVTYVLEAEVAHTMESDLIRYTYPVTFGRIMNFTLPAVASGPSIEADVDGAQIVFPLGPELRLSWATCRFESAADGTKQYRCELKPGYRFD